MSGLPFVVRVAIGAVSLAAEKGQEVAAGAIQAPITLGSKSAQTFIRVQQDLAQLAVRGDATIDTLFPPKQAPQAQWATFDDDEDVEVDLPDTARSAPLADTALGDVRPATGPTLPQPASPQPASPAPAAGDTSGAGRYALYSSPIAESGATESGAAGSDPASPASSATESPVPEVAERIDYHELTLAQLRGRLPKLSADDLTALVAYERDTRKRAPFITMLENRRNR